MKHAFTLSVCLAFAALPAAAAAAAQNPLPVVLGTPVTGTLAATDSVLGDGSYYDLYAFDGRRGQRIAITLRSTDFDAYLTVLTGPPGQRTVVGSNDDAPGSGSTDSRFTMTVTEDGPVIIRANSLEGGETGRYTLLVETDTSTAAPVPAAAAPAAMLLQLGVESREAVERTDATRDDGSHYDTWVFTAVRGERYRVVMRSGEFDAFLYVGRKVGGAFVELARDDDSGGGTDAQVDFTADADGRVYIRANGLSSRDVGLYRIQVDRITAR